MSVLCTIPGPVIAMLAVGVAWLLGCKLIAHEWSAPKVRPRTLVEEAEALGREALREAYEAAALDLASRSRLRRSTGPR